MNDKQKLALMRHLFDQSAELYSVHFNAYEIDEDQVGVLHLQFADEGGNLHHIGILANGLQRTYELV